MFSALALRHRWSQQSQDLWIKDKNEQSGLRLEIKKTVKGGAFLLKRIQLWSCEYVDVTDTADSCCFEVETVTPRKWLKATETDIGSIWRTNESLPTAELTWDHWLTWRNPYKRVYWRLNCTKTKINNSWVSWISVMQQIYKILAHPYTRVKQHFYA